MPKKKPFNIILSMYANTTTRIKFSNGLGAAFTSECGVKQGDVLINQLEQMRFFAHKGNLPSSARHATFDALQ
jgi:hypothetical protein